MVNDSELKIEAMSLLWELGYVVRPEVVLAQPKKRTARKDAKYIDLTDIDVLGYMFSPLLKMDTVAVDCGAGASRNIMERVFWTRGMMEAAGISSGICVLNREPLEEHRIAGDQLDVSLVSVAEFSQFKKTLTGVDNFVDFSGYYAASQEWFQYLGSNDDGLSNFLLKEHWGREWDRIPVQLPAQLRRWNVKLKPDKRTHNFALLELSVLLSLGLVRMALQLYLVRPKDFRIAAISFVMGGEKRLKMLEVMMQRIDELEHAISNHDRKAQHQADSNGSSVDVPFANELLDVVARLVAKPKSARMIPKCIQAFQLAYLDGDVRDFGKYTNGEIDNLVVKLSLDVVRYLSIASNTREEMLMLLNGI